MTSLGSASLEFNVLVAPALRQLDTFTKTAKSMLTQAQNVAKIELKVDGQKALKDIDRIVKQIKQRLDASVTLNLSSLTLLVGKVTELKNDLSKIAADMRSAGASLRGGAGGGSRNGAGAGGGSPGAGNADAQAAAAYRQTLALNTRLAREAAAQQTAAQRQARQQQQAADQQAAAAYRQSLALNTRLAREAAAQQAAAARQGAQASADAARAASQAARDAATQQRAADQQAAAAYRQTLALNARLARDAAAQQTAAARQASQAAAAAAKATADAARASAAAQTESVSKLGRELALANSKFSQGTVRAREYLREIDRIKTAATALQPSLQAGSRDALNLSRTLQGIGGAGAKINATSITNVRTELARARTAYEQAISAAGSSWRKQQDAAAQYQRVLGQVDTKIQQIGRRPTVTPQQTQALAQLQQKLASQQNALQGSASPLSFGGALSAGLKSLMPALSGLSPALGAASSQAGQLGGALGGVAEAAGPIGGLIAGITVVLVALSAAIVASVKTATQFQAIFADIKALTQPTIAEFQKLQAATFDLGKPLGVGAREAAGAVLELNKAGLSAADVIGGGLKGALDLAGAAGLTAAEGGVTATAAMTAFGLAAKDIPSIADTFANFANKTFLGASDLTQGIAAVGPVARSSGIDMQQFAGILATLAQGGFKNMSDAGTSLKTMLLSLASPTDAGQKYLKKLGVSAYDASGNMKPFTSIIGDLREKLIKLTPQAQNQILKQIFGTDAIRAAQILLREGPKALDANTKAMGKQGEAARVAKERLDSLAGSGKKFGAVFEELKIVIGTPFLGALKTIVDVAITVTQSLVDLVKQAQAGKGALGDMSAGGQQAMQALYSVLAPIFKAIASLWENILKPALVALYQIFTVIVTVVTTALGIVFSVASAVFSGVVGLIGGLLSAFTGGGNGIKISLAGVADTITRWAGVARAYIVAVGKVAGDLPVAFSSAGQGIGRIFAGIGKIFAGFAQIAYQRLVVPILPVVAAIKSSFLSVANVIGTTLSNLLNFVADKFRPLISFLQTIGIGIGDALASIVSSIGSNLRALTGGSADEFQKQAEAQAAAAQAQAAKIAEGNKLVADGLSDIKSGYDQTKTAASDFGKNANTVFAQTGKDLAAANAEAARLKKTLSAPLPKVKMPVATVPTQLASGTGTLADLGLGPKGKKSKAPPITAADLAAQDTYKKGLRDLTDAELANAKATAIRTNNKKQLSAILAEEGRRQREVTSETKAQESASKKAAAASERDAATRANLVREIRQSIQSYQLLASQHKITEKSQLSFNQRIEDFRASVAKLPPELQNGVTALLDQASALSKSTDGQAQATKATKLSGIALSDFKEALKGSTAARLKQLEAESRASKNDVVHAAVVAEQTRREGALTAQRKKATSEQEAQSKRDARTLAAQQKAADSLGRGLTNLIADFRLQTQQGKTTAESLQNFQQRLEGASEQAKRLPPALRENITTLLNQGSALAKTGQGVVDYRGQIETLKGEVDKYTLSELEAARAKALAAGNQSAIVKLLDKEIASRKTLSATQLDQADSESRLAQVSASSDNVEGEYQNRQALAKGNLATLYQLELQYGQRVQDARDARAREESANEDRQINDKYDKLGKLEGITDAQQRRLDADRTAELSANAQKLTNTLAANSTSRAASELSAKTALDAALLTVDRQTRDTIRKNNLTLLSAQTGDLEAQQQEALDVEGLTQQQTLEIRRRFQPLLIAQKQREVETSRTIEQQAETDRYNDAVDAATLNGTLNQKRLQQDGSYLTVSEALSKEHISNVALIEKNGADAVRDYALSVKRATGKQLVADDKATSDELVAVAKSRIDDQLQGLSEMDGKQRDVARAALGFWRQVYAAMGEAGKASLAEVDDAIKKLGQAGDVARSKASAVLAELPTPTAGSFARDLNAVGKTEDAGDARDSAEKQYDSLLKTYQGYLDKARVAFQQFADARDEDLTPADRQIRDGLLGTMRLYDDLISQITVAAAEAGDKAASAFTLAQNDKLAEGNLSLIEAQHALADQEGRDDGPAYRAGLGAALAYWKARKTGLTEGTPEYLAALQKVTELETKLDAASAQVRADKDQESALALVEARYALEQALGQDGGPSYLAGLKASLAYWQGRLTELKEGTPEYLAALQKVADLEGKVRSQPDKAAEGRLSYVEAQYALAQMEGRDGGPAYTAGLNAALAYWRGRLKELNEGTPEYIAALQKITDLEGKVRSQPDKNAEGAFALAEAQYALAQVEGRDGGPAYLAGLNASLAYWRGRLKELNEGTPEYIAALQKIADLEGKVKSVPDANAEGALALVEAEHALAELQKRDDGPAYQAGLNAALSYWRARLANLTRGTPEYLAALQKVTDLEGKLHDSGAQVLADKDQENALALIEARHALAEQEGKNDGPEYRIGLRASLNYWKGRLTGLKEGTPEYLAALQKITDLAGKIKAADPGQKLAESFATGAAAIGTGGKLQSALSAGLSGLGAFFSAGGVAGKGGAILGGAAALVGGLKDVFVTGNEDIDNVTAALVDGVQGTLGALAKGDWVGAIIAAVATVVNTVLNIIQGAKRSLSKAKSEIQASTQDVKFFDLGKYAVVQTYKGGFLGLQTLSRSVIDQQAIDIAKSLGDAIYEGISTGLLNGIKAGKASFGDLGIDLKKTLGNQILQGLIDGFLRGAAMTAILQPFLDAYVTAMKAGDANGMAAAAEGIQNAAAAANTQLQAFYQNVLVPTSKRLGLFGSEADTNSKDPALSSGLSGPSEVSFGGGDQSSNVTTEGSSLSAGQITVFTDALTAGAGQIVGAAQQQQAASTEFGGHVGRFGQFVTQFGQYVSRGPSTNWAGYNPQ